MNNFYNNPYGPGYTGPMYGASNGYSYQNQSSKPQMQQYAFVNGVEEAKGYSMSPNQTILLMDKSAPVCYMKSSDNFGQYSLKYFKLDEIDEVTAFYIKGEQSYRLHCLLFFLAARTTPIMKERN